MKVIDAIIELQKLPYNMDLMIDVSREDSVGFHFVEACTIAKVEDAMGQPMVVISPNELEEEEDN